MGIDAYIQFEATGSIEDLLDELITDWPESIGQIKPLELQGWEAEEYDCEGANFYVDTSVRHYGPWGGRGPGGLIIQALATLHRHPNIGRVWYGLTEQHWIPCTEKDVHALLESWMNGTK